MTREEASNLIRKVLHTNPGGNTHLVGQLQTHQPKSATPQALVRSRKKCKESKDGMGYRISLIAMLRRTLDSDNLVGSQKPLRDAIAATLGLDDADPRLNWEYAQVKTTGQEGVIVKIESHFPGSKTGRAT